jgi:methylamine utilization protein MauE
VDLGATVALVARITLAATFGLAAATKLVDRPGFARALRDFGLPRSDALSWALPLVEGGLALALVLVQGEAWPAFLAVAVLALFTGAVVANLIGDRPAPCPCFGPPTAAARPVSAATVARNGYLVALAVLGTGSTDGASVAAAVATAAIAVPGTLLALRRFG